MTQTALQPFFPDDEPISVRGTVPCPAGGEKTGRGKPRPYDVERDVWRASGAVWRINRACGRSGWRTLRVSGCGVLGFDVPVLCPRDRLHFADSLVPGHPRPSHLLHATT